MDKEPDGGLCVLLHADGIKSGKWNRKRHVHFSLNIRLSAEESFRSGFLLIPRAVVNAYSHPGPHHLSPKSISPSDLVRML